MDLDEHYMTAKHGGRGRQVRRHPKWIFGITERGSGNSYIKIVRRRDAATLLPVIFRHVRPGSTINSDEWRAYRRITLLPGFFRHLMVNHRVNFVDPVTGAHTQHIENTWSRWCDYVRRHHGIHDGPLRDHIMEFLWRERFGARNRVFFHLWSQIALFFPCNA